MDHTNKYEIQCISVNFFPGEVYHLLKINQEEKKSYLPMIFIDELSMRLKDLVKINKTDEQVTFNVEYSPTSFGKLRLFNQFQSSLGGLHGLGFTEKDTDEVKGIFADTNLVLLLVTFGVSAVHLLFDCLAFKNDISFWRNRETMEGSVTSVLEFQGAELINRIICRFFTHSFHVLTLFCLI